MRKVAVLVDNVGPYHLARLRAASLVVDLRVVEYQRRSDDYAWGPSESEKYLKSDTLVEAGPLPTRGELRDLVSSRLDILLPDVVAVPGWSHRVSLAALEWCTRHDVPVVMMSDSTEVDARRVLWRERLKASVLHLSATSFVAGSPQRDYLLTLGFPRESVFLGYDAVDNKYFRGKTAECRRQGGIEGGSHSVRVKPQSVDLPSHFFIASARFVEKKNLFRLLQAYAIYRNRRMSARGGAREGLSQPWALVLLGDGPLRVQLCRLISELGLERSVHLPGFKQYEDLPQYYSHASALIHASTTDQWGLVVNEAMASGLPVLVSNRCGCAQDLVEEGVNGFTFAPYDVDRLAFLMHQMASMDQGARKKMGLESQRIIACWDTDRFAQGLLASANRAIEVGTKKATLAQRVLLWLLIYRS